MTETEKLFLIVLLPETKESPGAKEQLEKKGWLKGLDGELRALGNIRLYNLPEKKSAENPWLLCRMAAGKRCC